MVSFALRQRRDQYIIRSNTAPVHTHKPLRMRYLTTLFLTLCFSKSPYMTVRPSLACFSTCRWRLRKLECAVIELVTRTTV